MTQEQTPRPIMVHHLGALDGQYPPNALEAIQGCVEFCAKFIETGSYSGCIVSRRGRSRSATIHSHPASDAEIYRWL